MLVLSRLVGQRILIGDNIWVEVLKLEGNRVSLGFEAPKEVRIVREELLTDEDPDDIPEKPSH